MIPVLALAATAACTADSAPNTAIFSPCRTWRYLLRRTWDEIAPTPRRALFIMLNPSTADETQDDPTIRRCIGFAKRWGFDGVEIVNLFAFRATDPRELGAVDVVKAIGPRNDQFIDEACRRAPLIVCAWGNHGKLHGRSTFARVFLAPYELQCFKVTKSGEAEHPLYQPYTRELVRYL